MSDSVASRSGPPVSSGRLLLAVALAALAGGAAVALLAVSARLIARAALEPPLTELVLAIVAVRALAIVRATARYAERLATHDAAFRTLARWRAELYARLATRLPRPGMRTGDVLQRFVGDVETAQDLLVAGAVPLAGVATTVVGGTLVLAVLLPSAVAPTAVALVIAGVLVPTLAWHQARWRSARIIDGHAGFTAAVTELADTAAELRVHGAFEATVERVTDEAQVVERETLRHGMAAGGLALVVTVVTGVVTAGVIWIAAPSIVPGTPDSVLLATAVVLAFATFEQLQQVPELTERLNAGARALERVDGFLVDDRHPAPPMPRPEGPGALHLVDVDVRDDTGTNRLRIHDLAIPARLCTAVLGPSGAGKTTLAEVLVGFSVPSAGTLDVDGSTACGQSWQREVVGLATQVPHVLPTTLSGNLRTARPDAEDHELLQVLEDVELGGLVDDLADGLETDLTDRPLSGGEAQRLGLARLLLAEREIVVLDEPTAHIDRATASRVISRILERTRGRTVVIITHEPAIAVQAHQVVVIDQGCIVEEGPPMALLDAAGPFARIARLDGLAPASVSD